MMDRCWLGETNFDYPFSSTDLPQAVAIQINGNDHYILNTVVFSSKVGLEVNGAANYIVGVHVWFPENQALAFVSNGVMAFHITAGQNRFNGCYIDGSRAVFEGGGLVDNVWTNGFECCAGLPQVPHGIELRGNKIGPGLQILHNIFEGGNIFSTPTDGTSAVTVEGAVIAYNSFGGSNPAATRATLTLSQTAATQWLFNFCGVLIVPTIARVSLVSVSAATGFPTAVVRTSVNCTVLVETSEPVTGDVSVMADASRLTDRFV